MTNIKLEFSDEKEKDPIVEDDWVFINLDSNRASQILNNTNNETKGLDLFEKDPMKKPTTKEFDNTTIEECEKEKLITENTQKQKQHVLYPRKNATYNRRSTIPIKSIRRKGLNASKEYQLLVEKITTSYERGAITLTNANNLREQLMNSPPGQWESVKKRLSSLTADWNPYQHVEVASPNVDSSKQERRRPGRKKLPNETFYRLLGVSSSASLDEIKKAFRVKALKKHPDKNPAADTKEFSKLKSAFETLINPETRLMYDRSLEDNSINLDFTTDVSNQKIIEGTEGFAAFEWMNRVKHKMDILDRLRSWASLLSIPFESMRFERGVPCSGLNCGKIVSMDRDLEASGSSRRRVFVCMMHHYVHACDSSCTSNNLSELFEVRICPIRASWLVQSWIYDRHCEWKRENVSSGDNSSDNPKIIYHHIVTGERRKKKPSILYMNTGSNTEVAFTLKDTDAVELEKDEFHPQSPSSIENELSVICDACNYLKCEKAYITLDEGVWVCTVHGTPHVCTYSQCTKKNLVNGYYQCGISKRYYGEQTEELGSEVRKRQVYYTNRFGDRVSTEMEVPVFLPLGADTKKLLTSSSSTNTNNEFAGNDPKDMKLSISDDSQCIKKEFDDSVQLQADSVKENISKSYIHSRIVAFDTLNERQTYEILIQVPEAVASIPSVTPEIENGFLPLRVKASSTIEDVKVLIETISDVAPFDQQLLWDGAIVGEGIDEDGTPIPILTTLLQHGIKKGSILELRLHEDCPMNVSTWNPQLAAGKSNMGGLEYNTVSISKEAEEDIIEQQEEWENQIAMEENQFQDERRLFKRQKLEQMGAVNHVELVEFNGNVPRLVGLRSFPHTPKTEIKEETKS